MLPGVSALHRCARRPGVGSQMVLWGHMGGWLLALFAAMGIVSASLAQSAPPETPAKQAATIPTPSTGVPAARAAKNVAVITIHGEIDVWTARSVIRRIHEAIDNGADAIAFDLDTPGGDLTAFLAITTAIKSCSIQNTVAWVHPTAYSGGAVIALSCREIVVPEVAVLGDAFPVRIDLLGQLEALPEAEREKFVSPMLSEVVDSARRNGYDEVLVQGFVRRGVELWLIEHKTTHQRLFVTAAQYEQAVGELPMRTQPSVPSFTGPNTTGRKPVGGYDPSTGAKPGGTDGSALVPGAPNMSKDLTNEVNEKLQLLGSHTSRPNLAAPENAGQYRVVEYVSDGYGVLIFHSNDLLRYRLASAKINSDADLKAFFGATNVAVMGENWAEVSARVLSMLPVRAVLLIIFLVSLFIEITHPGLLLPGAAAGLALIALVLPQVLLSLAAWWMVGAVLVGIFLLLLELFVLPGFGVPGVLGVVLLFGGLVGLFIGGSGSLFPGRGMSSGDSSYTLATLLVSICASVGVMFLIWRALPSLPVFNRLVLRNDPDDGGESLLSAMGPSGKLARGAVGVATTSLRPAGRARFGDSIHEVVAEIGFIESGTRVVVVSSNQFRTTVHAANDVPGPEQTGA